MRAPSPIQTARARFVDLLVLPLLFVALVGLPLGLALAPESRAESPAPTELFLENAHLVDPERRTISRGGVLIHEGRIREIRSKPPQGFRGERVDLKGKWILPSLKDLHVHSWGNPAPTGEEQDQESWSEGTTKLMLKAGVTAFLDLGTAEDTIFPLRDRQREARARGEARAWEQAEILASGPPIMAKDGEKDRERVRARAKRKPDVIKIHYDHYHRRTHSREALGALIEESRSLGLKTVVHIGKWKDAEEAVRAGATAITHLDDDGPIPDSLARLMKARGTFAIPTMAVQCDFARHVTQPTLLESPLLQAVTTPELRASYRKRDRFIRKARFWMEWQPKSRQLYFQSIRRLHAAGVRILAGSDTGNLGVFQGYSAHREIELLAEAGLPAWEALAAGTTAPAALLGRPYGLKPGDPADLLVLDGSPADDVRNTQRISRVLYRGKWVLN